MGFGVLLQESPKNTSTVGNANDYCSKNNPDKVLSSFSTGTHFIRGGREKRGWKGGSGGGGGGGRREGTGEAWR